MSSRRLMKVRSIEIESHTDVVSDNEIVGIPWTWFMEICQLSLLIFLIARAAQTKYLKYLGKQEIRLGRRIMESNPSEPNIHIPRHLKFGIKMTMLKSTGAVIDFSISAIYHSKDPQLMKHNVIIPFTTPAMLLA